MKEGPLGGSFDALSETDVHRIHGASIRLLEDYGIVSESDLILEMFAEGGAQVEEGSRKVRIPRELVDEALDSAPRQFVFYGRLPGMDLLLEAGRVYFGMGGTPEPFFWDYELQEPRPATKDDMVAATRLGHSLPDIDFVMSLASAGDVSPEIQYLHEYDAILRNTTKPIVYMAPGRKYAARFLEMAAAVCGGEENLRNRPFVMLFTQPVSPLKFGPYMEGMLEAVDFGIPILPSPGPMMGATSPATLAGTLVQVNAEALAGIVLSQLIKPGTPVVYGPHTGVMDMSYAQCTYGDTAQAVARAGVAQLGRFYELPSFGLGGGTEAKRPDAQAAAEAMQGMLLNALSGLTLTQTLGTMASGKYGSLEMLVICNEIVRMVKRVLAGVDVTEETLALDVIKEVGAGGHFLDNDHTLKMFRREFYFPALFDRSGVEAWQAKGGKSIEEVARDRVREILADFEPVPLTDSADSALRRCLVDSEDEFFKKEEWHHE